MSLVALPVNYSGNFNPFYGSFSGNADQTINKDSPTVALFDTTEISYGVSLVAQTQLTVSNDGIYECSFSPQLAVSGGTKTEIITWLRLDGNNIARTSSRVELGNNNSTNFPYFSYILSMSAGQYVEFVVSASTLNATLEYHPAKVNPPDLYNAPSDPSIIAIVKRIG